MFAPVPRVAGEGVIITGNKASRNFMSSNQVPVLGGHHLERLAVALIVVDGGDLCSPVGQGWGPRDDGREAIEAIP